MGCFASGHVKDDDMEDGGLRPSSPRHDKFNVNVNTAVRERYEILDLLGKGAYSEVMLARDKVTEEEVAVKILRKDSEEDERSFSNEVGLLRCIRHKNILSLKTSLKGKTRCYIITEVLHGGELFDLITSKTAKITERMAKKWIRQMLKVIKYLHKRDIVHRDIKPENFVFRTKDLESELVLIDFGMAIQIKPHEENAEMVGTVEYISPEIVLAAGFKGNPGPLDGATLRAADMWACGVIAYLMLVGHFPFVGYSNLDVYKSILGCRISFARAKHLSEPCKEFLRSFFKKKVEDRPTPVTCLSEPWVKAGTLVPDKDLSARLKHSLRKFQTTDKENRFKAFVARAMARKMAEQEKEQCHDLFEYLDTDGDGEVDPDSSRKESPRQPQNESPRRSLRGRPSPRGRGVGGRIDYDRFEEIYQWSKLKDSKEKAALMRMLDPGETGFIDLEELARFLNLPTGVDVHDLIKDRGVGPQSGDKISVPDFYRAISLNSDDEADQKAEAPPQLARGASVESQSSRPTSPHEMSGTGGSAQTSPRRSMRIHFGTSPKKKTPADGGGLQKAAGLFDGDVGFGKTVIVVDEDPPPHENERPDVEVLSIGDPPSNAV